jgi:hypothetical protein
MEQRIIDYEISYSSLPSRRHSCITPKGLLKHVQFTHRLASGLFGNVYAAILRQNDKSIYRNIRTLPKFHNNLKKKPQFVVKLAFRSDSHLLESKISNYVSDIVYYQKCAHFPLSFGYYLCNKVDFIGRGVFKEAGDWERIKKGSGIIHLSEYTGIGYQAFLDLLPSANEILASIAQVLIAVYTLQKHQICHNDLYFSNITMKAIDKPTVFKYTVNKRKYDIKVLRFIPVIIDFGQSSHVPVKNKESGDIFHFLTGFSVSPNGSRPFFKNSSLVITQHVPSSVKKSVQSMLSKLVISEQSNDHNAPFSSHLSKSFMTSDRLLKESFPHFIKIGGKSESSHRFII